MYPFFKNWMIGIGMKLVGVGISLGIGRLVHSTSERLLVIICGLVLVALDVTYRSKSEGGHWISPRGGGHVFIVPVWALGIVCLVGSLWVSKEGTWKGSNASQQALAGVPNPPQEALAAAPSAPQDDQEQLQVFKANGCQLSAPATWAAQPQSANPRAKIVVANSTGESSVGISYEPAVGTTLTQRHVAQLMDKANTMPLKLEDSNWSMLDNHDAWREIRVGSLRGSNRIWIRYSYKVDSAVVQVIGVAAGRRSREERELLETIIKSAHCEQ